MNGRVGFEILPFRNTESAQIIFQQPDIFRGLQQWRGLDQPTTAVDDRYDIYGRMCVLEPGYWGEHDFIDEAFMTRAAQPNSCMDTLDLTGLMVTLQQRLLERRYNRVEFSIWQALVFGRYEALNQQGQIVAQATYNIQQVAVPIPWTTILTSAPLDNFRTVQLLSRGTSTDFGSCATAYMNRVTANQLFRNQNPNDVGKAGLTACCTFMGLDIVNQQFAAQGLPQINIYDQGYIDDAGNFQPYIPDGKVVIVGCRPGGVPPGHYWLTRNMVNCGVNSGFWMKVHDNCEYAVPRKIMLYDGHNGGPGIEYVRQIVTLTVF